MVRDYIKKIYPGTWSKAYTPPAPSTYEVSFDTSSQYITNTITPFSVTSGTNAECISSQTNVVTFTDGGVSTPITMQLADERTAITSWSANGTVLGDGFSINISANTQFVPTVTHTVIHKDTQGPCPNGFHIGTQTEWNTVLTALTTLGVANETDTMNYLKMPAAYYLNRTNGSKNTSYGMVRIWTSTMTNNTTAYCFYINENHALAVASDKPGNAFSIRPLKDNPIAPDSSWTTLYQGTGSAGIFWNSTLGLISISQNGTTWTTMTDKNLGATNVGDDGLYYQFGNNNGFTVSPSNYRTSKVSNTQGYGPGNYYNDVTYTRCSSGNGWFTDTNNNIWGGVTNGTWTDPV